jgi:hypothetical protein
MMTTSPPHPVDRLLRKEQETLVSQSGPKRRVLHLEVIEGEHAVESPSPRTRAVRRAAPGSRWGVPVTRDGWLCLAERTVGGWASTLHGALLMLAGIAGFAVLIGIIFGFGGVALGLLIAVTVWPVAGRPSR